MIELLLQNLLEEFQSKLTQIDNFTLREASFSRATNKIKVAMGMRRAGKSTFLLQNIKSLIEDKSIELNQILYINFEDDRLLPMSQQELATLLEKFYQLFPENHTRKCYLFLDEIQNVDDWPLVIRRFFDSKLVEIFLSGSSAKLLSKEIHTSLRGRSLSTEIWPFNFAEYQVAKKIPQQKQPKGKIYFDKLRKVFLEYLDQGGFPEIIDYSIVDQKQTLLEYVQVTTLRDIIERHQVNNHALIKYFIKYLLCNPASKLSINKLYNDLKSQGYALSRETLHDYLAYIEDAYLIFSVPLFADSYRKSQNNAKKIYAIDTGLLKAYSIGMQQNLGKRFENLIYLDLRRQQCEIYYYLTKERYEVDFLAINPAGKSKLFQIVWDMDNPETFERENRALQQAMAELNLPGEIITLESYLRHGINFL